MNKLEKLVSEFLRQNPGVKVNDIVSQLGYDAREIRSVLYKGMRSSYRQDSAYRWYLEETAPCLSSLSERNCKDDGLSLLCDYYLNCLSLEDSNCVSVFLKSSSRLDYAEISGVGLDDHLGEAARTLLRKVSADRRLSAYVGYPILIEKNYAKRTGQPLLKLAPVFLFPIETVDIAEKKPLIPRINMEVVRQFSLQDPSHQIYDLIELENELGLNAWDTEICIEDLVSRLQAIRTWQWKEPMDPLAIKTDPPISEMTEEGIWNRAVVIVAERSSYTIGLESELSQLSKLQPEAYHCTALYDWLHQDIADTQSSKLSESDDLPLLEILPMNTEQEQAVSCALKKNLTVITGPPGTGKSQVVTNLLANAAWRGESVLFTSKNNKAVDVVESRINQFGSYPVLLRMGGTQYAGNLADTVSKILFRVAAKTDSWEYEENKRQYAERIDTYRKLKSEKDRIRLLRNDVDHKEQEICFLRETLGKVFYDIKESVCADFASDLDRYLAAYEVWFRSKHSFFGRLRRLITGRKTDSNLERSLTDLNVWFREYGQPIPAERYDVLNEAIHRNISELGASLLSSMKSVCDYQKALDLLLKSKSFEALDKELFHVKKSISVLSKKLWENWLEVRSVNLDNRCLSEMREYVAAMRFASEVDLVEYPVLKERFNRIQNQLGKLMPCWAVTSLSAHRRIPFQPGMFDLLVIDEASQCDIASILPMLYRAKRAVLIGDPKQLTHIADISARQDLHLLQKYGIALKWSYAANSLYDLAETLAPTENIIRLRDHHRCHNDIIQFSNTEFYERSLRVATRQDMLKRSKQISVGVRWCNAVGTVVHLPSGSVYNQTEISVVLQELRKLALDESFDGTIGVVTPFKGQAIKIKEAVIRDPMLKNIVSSHDFLVDTVHKFQGDERDLIFFSPVISVGMPKGALSFLQKTGNLFNVAITRARSSLIVVGNAEACSRCGIPYLEHFVSYVIRVCNRNEKDMEQSSENSVETVYPIVSNPEQISDWERIFYMALLNCGIRSIPQYEEDKYKLDLAVMKGSRKLDIEIDGEMYHKDWSGELCYRDQLRNQRLFELGWDVKRFWVYQLCDDLQGCVDQIIKWYQG